MSQSQVRSFFPEPHFEDQTWASESEAVVDWITHSTLPRAREVRRFLNHNLGRMPQRHQEQFARNLRYRWKSALFELVVARVFQELGAELEVEVCNREDRRPDFLVSLRGASLVVEAVAPEFDLETEAKIKQDAKLLEIVERNAPQGCSIFLSKLPAIGLSESKASLKDAVRRLDPIASSLKQGEKKVFRMDLPQGEFSGLLLAGRHGHTVIVGGPGYSNRNDSKDRISRALKRKKRQTRAAEAPVLLAMLASGISSSFEDFDEVLLGTQVALMDQGGAIDQIRFDISRKFAGRPLPRAVVGVLAFAGLTPFGVIGPILYVHPQAPDFPPEYGAFEQRTVANSKIVRVTPSARSPFSGLCFAELEPRSN